MTALYRGSSRTAESSRRGKPPGSVGNLNNCRQDLVLIKERGPFYLQSAI
jgi:hypothetical protein